MASKVVVKTEMIIFGHTVVTFNDGSTKVYDRSAGITPPQVGDIVGEPDSAAQEPVTTPVAEPVPAPTVMDVPATETGPVAEVPAATPPAATEGQQS